MYTPSNNTDPMKATYGTKGSDVLALQKALNAKGAGLKEDALYGPLTQAAFAKYNAPINTEPTTNTPIAKAFQMPEIEQNQPNFTGQYDPNTGGYKDTVDTSAIRSQTLADFQDRINSINQVYAGKLAEAQQQGVGRVGSTTALLANRGLTGSIRGGAIAEGTLAQNRQIEDAINAEKAAAISAIYSEVNSTAQAEAQRRREAIESGAKSYIEYIKGQETTKSNNTNKIASAFIAQGIDPNNLTPEELNKISSGIGTSSGNLITAYKAIKAQQDAENLKNFPTKELSQGEALFQYDPTTGTYKQVGLNPKTATPKAVGSGGGTSGGSSSSAYKNDLDAVIGATLVTIPSKFGQEQFNAQLSKARNDGDKINLIASTVLKNSPNEVKTDFSNQSIAVSNIDKAIAEIDKGAKTGVINNALQKGFNLIGKDYDPALQSVAAYIVSAVQPYRNSVTGAAWGSQEENEYQQLFGSTAFSPAELKQRLERLKGIMVNKSVQGLNTFVNPLNTYANPFTTVNPQSPVSPVGGTVTVYSIKTGKPAQIPAGSLQQALSSGLFRQ